MILIIFASCKDQKKRSKLQQESSELNTKAFHLMIKNNYDSALILYDKSIAIDKDNFFAYFNKMSLYCRLRDYNNALREVEKSLKINPDFAPGLFWAGLLNEKQGDMLKAKRYYSYSIKMYDKNIATLKNKNEIESAKLDRIIVLKIMGYENESKMDLLKLKETSADTTNINEYLGMSKQDLMSLYVPK